MYKILCFIAIFMIIFTGCSIQSKNLELENEKNNDIKLFKNQTVCADKTPQECNDEGVKFEIKADFARAKIYYQKACDSNLGVACSNLGSLYQKTEEYAKEEILGLFIKSCELGSVYGCFNAANLYRTTAKNEQELVKAIKLYEKACIEKGHAQSCTNLGSMHQLSLGVESENRDTAKKFYKIGCDLGDEIGCKNLSLLIE